MRTSPRAPWTVRVATSVLLPATMTLVGDWNWWLPRWLGWLPNVTIESACAEPELEPELAPLAN